MPKGAGERRAGGGDLALFPPALLRAALIWHMERLSRLHTLSSIRAPVCGDAEWVNTLSPVRKASLSPPSFPSERCVCVWPPGFSGRGVGGGDLNLTQVGPQPPGGALQHIRIVCSLQLIAFEVGRICILKINRCLSNA